MMIPRRGPCPHCGKLYYIRENGRVHIVECCQIAGGTLRQCLRCGWRQEIEPREEEEVKAIREQYGREKHAGEADRDL